MKKKLPRIINEEEFEKLMLASSRIKCGKKRRLRIKQYQLAMLLAFRSGLRISEILGLRKLKSKCCNVEIIGVKENEMS